MIVHARVAKLYSYLHDENFSGIMRHIEGALEEGLDNFELDVAKLDDDPKFDLLEALETMGYTVLYDNEREIFEVDI